MASIALLDEEQDEEAAAHRRLWGAVDAMAKKRGISPSRMALVAGLDPTSLNRSKRIIHGRMRWPSYLTILRILRTQGFTMREFVRLMEGAEE